MNPDYTKDCLDALRQLCARLNEIELEGHRVAGFRMELYPQEAGEDEFLAWIESYRSKVWESWPLILDAEHPLRLAGCSRAVGPLRKIVFELESLYQRLGGDVDPQRVGEALRETSVKLDALKDDLYGWVVGDN